MPDLDVEALGAQCVRFMGATLAWRSRAILTGDGKLADFAQRAAAIAGALCAALDLHASIEGGGGPAHCAHCGIREIHPCPTVRAIAEKLGVEAGHG
jgi:hypothetical protein